MSNTNYIGVVYVIETKEIRAVINPDYDTQLDDPAHTKTSLEGEKLSMIKIPRISEKYGICPSIMSPNDCSIAINIAKEMLGVNQ